MKWDTKIKLGMELIHEACKENSELLDSCEACPFETYCSVIWDELAVAPIDWTEMDGEDIR